MQIQPLGERVLLSHLVSFGLGRIHPVLRLSGVVEVREDATYEQRLKGKILMLDFLLVGEQKALRVMKKKKLFKKVRNKGKKWLSVERNKTQCTRRLFLLSCSRLVNNRTERMKQAWKAGAMEY